MSKKSDRTDLFAEIAEQSRSASAKVEVRELLYPPRLLTRTEKSLVLELMPVAHGISHSDIQKFRASRVYDCTIEEAARSLLEARGRNSVGQFRSAPNFIAQALNADYAAMEARIAHELFVGDFSTNEFRSEIHGRFDSFLNDALINGMVQIDSLAAAPHVWKPTRSEIITINKARDLKVSEVNPMMRSARAKK